MKKYKTQLESKQLASRWSKSVDFSSPMSSWSNDMFKLLSLHAGDKKKAQNALFNSRIITA
jgi:hypothetical protein